MATATPPAIAALPAAPDPNNRTTFNTLAYPWSAALPTFGTEVAAVAANVKANADDAATSAATATTQAGLATTNGAAQVVLAEDQVVLADAAAAAALATADAVLWVSGTTYTLGQNAISPINFHTYRRKVAGAGTTDPSLDATNWLDVGPISAGLTLGTPVATTSGTAFNFTGIPAGTKLIVITFKGVGIEASGAKLLVKIGDAGGVEATGYLSVAAYDVGGTFTRTTSTAGFVCPGGSGVTNSLVHGSMTLTLENATAFTWVAAGVLGDSSGSQMCMHSGSKSLSAELDRVQITNVDGYSFNAREINIAYQ